MPPGRILVADDDPSTRASLRELLDGQGHEAEVVSDGASALDALLSGRFDVAILDISMPRLSGWEVAKRVRQELPDAELGLIALTVRGAPEDRARSHEVGFDLHLVKPVDPPRLLQEVDRLDD